MADVEWDLKKVALVVVNGGGFKPNHEQLAQNRSVWQVVVKDVNSVWEEEEEEEEWRMHFFLQYHWIQRYCDNASFVILYIGHQRQYLYRELVYADLSVINRAIYVCARPFDIGCRHTCYKDMIFLKAKWCQRVATLYSAEKSICASLAIVWEAEVTLRLEALSGWLAKATNPCML